MKPTLNGAMNPTSLPAEQATPDLIADQLREAILRGEIAPGTPLRQEDIAARFGVSRIPVREALRHLAAEGIVTFHLRRGATVSQLSPVEATELLEIRAVLETQAVRWAMPRLDTTILAKAEAVLDEAERTADINRWSELNWRFHATLFEPAGRPRLVTLIKQLNSQIDRFVRVLVSRSDYRFQAEAEHRAILAACRVKNADAAACLIRQHIEDTGAKLAEFLSQHR